MPRRNRILLTVLMALAAMFLGVAPAGAAPLADATSPAVSSPDAAYFATRAFTAAVPTIIGAAIVGHVLAAAPGAWKPKPAKISYQWYHAGKAIPKATGVKYKLTTADLGKRITVRATVSKPGFKTAAKMSKPTLKVVRAPTAKPKPPVNAYYGNCAAARAAGVAPIYRGQPGYRAGLDRDNDGIACE